MGTNYDSDEESDSPKYTEGTTKAPGLSDIPQYIGLPSESPLNVYKDEPYFNDILAIEGITGSMTKEIRELLGDEPNEMSVAMIKNMAKCVEKAKKASNEEPIYLKEMLSELILNVKNSEVTEEVLNVISTNELTRTHYLINSISAQIINHENIDYHGLLDAIKSIK